MNKKQILFSIAPVTVIFLLGEVGVRVAGVSDCEAIVPSATGWEQMVGDPRYLWKLEPDRLFESPAGNTQINSVGLRTELLPTTPKGTNEKRVLVTGDSSVYGWGQPDGKTYAEQLQTELNRAFSGVDFSVINLGVPGYSTEQTLLLLEDIGWSYQPDLVVVHNIFSDCNIDAFQDEAALALANPDGSFGRKLLHSSRLYCSVYMPWANFQSTLNQETNRVLMPGIPTGANAATALEKIDTVIDLSRVPLQDYLSNLDTIQKSASELGAGMIVAPLAQEWDVGIWNVPMAKPTADQVLPWFPYRDAQTEWAEKNSVGQVYLPDVFSAYGGNKAALFIDNMHPSVLGAAVMARAVTEQVRKDPGVVGLTESQLVEVWSSEISSQAESELMPNGGFGANSGTGGNRVTDMNNGAGTNSGVGVSGSGSNTNSNQSGRRNNQNRNNGQSLNRKENPKRHQRRGNSGRNNHSGQTAPGEKSNQQYNQSPKGQ